MARQATTYIPTGTAAATRPVDVLTFPLNGRPQSLTLYCRFLEMGMVLATSSRLVTIGSNAAANPRVYIDSSGTYYRGTHHNGTSSVTATLAAAPSLGQSVELRLTVAPTGAVTVGQSIAGGTESVTSTTAALALAQSWASAHLAVENIALRDCVVVRGVQTMATMRRVAGTA
jgi:hypothetical protein